MTNHYEPPQTITNHHEPSQNTTKQQKQQIKNKKEMFTTMETMNMGVDYLK